jgi:NADPH-dependent curcumin reductase CurA
MKNRQWLLARRPQGAIQDSDFNFVETDAPTPGEGEVLVRNLMLSCDPTQRAWIAFDTYLPAVKIGEVVRSIGAGRIVASNNPGFAVGCCSKVATKASSCCVSPSSSPQQWGWCQRPSQPKPPRASSNPRWQLVLTNL